ncbi:MAG: arylesterase [Candidatus Yonathbacteria bacterium CG_4_10_14_3_um_filter_47_65]|uniref:SGNH hydrolase-type esterase domain-containing protein n=2 Tax=Parcubacteria group TaxID=1794811 RepID=A0A1J4VEZ0_9BACT|nr:MAG: hypothetical protein AUJ44_01670 [Candidatus Nomurabacteria bacterium CG1_02_47_685]PIP03589.1 MAG: arylesterase [Candidatus Yonathbacteria bacterium CG23_combo_of_CG06-09_8_20_14_all_46_18]PIQ31410.1 MAG: arylesterase [Candidatus Yonathbacteria bacterium CG17_big_fil_post_rev_8_21_14_2_50_46_19]PIX56367.1 MAG: arylesterase [Candidatus Yonathbacteria bacterium CG_4_10_14_3_um_filter_47_65]PIY57515.1 MAG: arylesterase [Candidatus Yonathbacteria bacterium CG_4_10_14_0_8_um_filter_47_645]
MTERMMLKKYIFVVVAVFVIALIAGYFWLRPDTSITNYPSSGANIIAFGDSLVRGVGASEGHNFVDLLSEKTGRSIANLGVAGDTTADGLARVNELDKYQLKVVLVLLGGNDHLKKVPIDETFDNLARLIENIQSRGAIVLLLGVRGGLFADRFADRYEALSKKYHTAYVPDILDGLFAHPEYMSDEIHPNEKGYAKIAERIYPVLENILQ